MAKSGSSGHNELLENAREQHLLTREELAERIGAPEPRIIYGWEREGILPQQHYRKALCGVFKKSPRELGFVKKGEVPFWNVPYRRNPYFTGRERILTQVHTILEKERTAPTSQALAICGLGGIGKTQLVLAYTHQYSHEYQSILWVQADSQESLTSSFAKIAVLLRLTESDTREQQKAVEDVQRWLETYTRWLLIFDNVTDRQLLDRFIPLQGKGHTLLTTRAQFTGIGVQNIDLEALDAASGADFLLRRAKIIPPDMLTASATDYESAKTLSQLMGGFPLALDQAGAYLEETGCSVSEFLEIYRSEGIGLLAECDNSANEHPKAVVSTLILSFEKVRATNARAAMLLQFLAFLHPDAIPEEIITAGACKTGLSSQSIIQNKKKVNALIRELRKFSFIRRDRVKKILTIHRLVQAVLKSMLDDQETAQWAERVVRAVNRIFPEVTVASWPQCERILAQAQGCAELIKFYQFSFPEAARLLGLAGRYLYERGRFDEAEPLLHQALAIRVKSPDPDHLAIATSMNDLALLYRVRGKYEQAEALYTQALEVRKQLLGPEHPDTATVLYNLAVLYHTQGKYARAEAPYQQALQIRKNALGMDHLDTAACLDELAVLYADQGDFAQAIALCQDALAIKERILEPEHRDIAISLTNLAGFYHTIGKYALAEPLYERAHAIFEKALGPHHIDTATSLDSLAGLYADQEKYQQAETLAKQALKIKDQALGTEHPELLQSLIILASLYQKQKKYRRSEEFFLRTLAICEKTLGEEHAYTAGSLTYLAALYTEQGMYEQAEAFSRRALKIKKKTLGPEHPSTAATLDNLAAIFRGEGKYRRAETLCCRALAIRKKVLDPQHLDIAESLSTLASIYSDEGREKEAQQLLSRALAIRAHMHGAEHTESVRATENDDRLQGFIAACCELHPNAASSASDLWAAYQQWARESEERFVLRSQRAFASCLKSFGCTPYHTNEKRMWRGIGLQKPRQSDGDTS
jgi:tetratricopeptide (TPR) repeat protein/transcriptional regulator with XRE-family HTH domain